VLGDLISWGRGMFIGRKKGHRERTLTTTRRALLSATRSDGIPPVSASHARAEPTGGLASAIPLQMVFMAVALAGSALRE